VISELSVISRLWILGILHIELNPIQPWIISVGADSTGCLTVAIALSSPLTISFKRDEDQNGREVQEKDLMVDHLPPITLIFRMPRNYPSQVAVDVEPECAWADALIKERLRSLTRSAADAALSDGGEVALFRIKEAIAGMADLEEGGLPTLGHGRLILPSKNPEGARLRPILERHDATQRQAVFAEDTFMCGICIEQNLKGRRCVRLPQCGHVFCRECLEGYFTVLIREGVVSAVGCPDPGCSKAANTGRQRAVGGGGGRCVGDSFRAPDCDCGAEDGGEVSDTSEKAAHRGRPQLHLLSPSDLPGPHQEGESRREARDLRALRVHLLYPLQSDLVRKGFSSLGGRASWFGLPF
jgi:hypothetical protein